MAKAHRAGLTVQLPPLADFRSGARASLISPAVLRGAVRAFEFGLTALIGLVVALAYVAEANILTATSYPMALLAVSVATVITFELLGLYKVHTFSSILRHMPRVIMGWTAAFAGLVAVVVTQRQDGSTAVRIGGNCVTTARGRLVVPD